MLFYTNLKRCVVITTALFLAFAGVGCKKYLEKTTDKKLVVISSLNDLQSLLDNFTFVNYKDEAASEISSDNYYVTDADYESRLDYMRNTYIWNKENVFPLSINDWSYSYDNIYRANVVLDNIEKFGNSVEANNIKGQALFLRAKNFLQNAIVWCVAYDETSAANDLGLPLRLDPDFNKLSVRSNLKDTYGQIVDDLMQAIELLPNTAIHSLRPSKAAAYGLAARAYLSMRNYAKAGLYADLCLQLKNSISDYNNSNVTAPFPFPEFSSSEIIYSSLINMPSILAMSRLKIDPLLFKSYDTADLRRSLFFKDNGNSTYAYKGSYSGSSTFWSGIATDEILLMRAECFARAGNKELALNDLNSLLEKRWKRNVSYIPIEANDANEALAKILIERRKELIFRGLRWMDIKRLNKEGANITLTRTVKGQTYTLAPNDLRFALAIPEDVILITGMPQNPR